MTFPFCTGCRHMPTTACVVNFYLFQGPGSQSLLSVSSVRCKGQQRGVQLQCEGSCWRGWSFPPSLHLPTKGRAEAVSIQSEEADGCRNWTGQAPLGCPSEHRCWGHRREVHSRAIRPGPQDPAPSSFSDAAELSNRLLSRTPKVILAKGKQD